MLARSVYLKILLAVLPLALNGSSARADVLFVNPVDPGCNGGSPCFGTLQGAVDTASSGDVIRLQAGTYIEQVLVADLNNFSGSSESDRIVIEADPSAAAGSVILDGAKDVCTNGQAIAFSRSRYVTLRGLVITGAGGQGVRLKGGSNANTGIHIVGNRIFGNGSNSCNGGITAHRGNPDTLIANNLIYGNGRNGISFHDATGGPHRIIGNTIHANGWSGVRVARNHDTLLANNLVTANGTQSGATGGRFGVNREGSTSPVPEGIELRNNLLCGNRLGEINGPALDVADADNLTPTGSEGFGVGASPGCELLEAVYASLGDPESAAVDFSLAAASLAIDTGLDPRTLGLGAALDPIFEADFDGEDARPLDGDDDGSSRFDAGALESGAGAPPAGDPPTVLITDPLDGATLSTTPITVTGTATDADAVNVSGIPATLIGGVFTAVVPLVEGSNALVATATNVFGLGTDTVQVTLDAPPAIAITSPAEGELFTAATALVEGTVSDAIGLASVDVNGVMADIVGNSFSVLVALALGDNVLTATATDTFGSTSSVAITVTRGDAPTLAISFPVENAVVSASPVDVTGSFTGTAPVDITVEGVPATVGAATFAASAALVEGANPLTVTASNAYGAATAVVTVVLDTTAPVVSIDSPPDGTVTSASLIQIEGTVADASAITSVIVAGIPAAVAGTSFEVTIPLSPGANSVTAIATDAAGNSGSASIAVTFAVAVGSPDASLLLGFEATDAQISGLISPCESGGEVVPESLCTQSVLVYPLGESPSSGPPLAEAPASSGAFTVGGLADKTLFALFAKNDVPLASGETTAIGGPFHHATLEAVNPPASPPLAATVATEPDTTVALDLAAAVSFLYSGPDPIQDIADPGVLDPLRVAIVRGEVQDSTGTALPGVRVSVRGRPELGKTITQADGHYDLAVNGGGSLTLDFRFPGSIPAQRRVDLRWRDFSVVAPVVLLPLDAAATNLDLANPTAAVQVARGSLSSDADGSRQATVLFPAGITAVAELPGGESLPLGQITVRMTEFTVGDLGPSAMPAALPPTSGYTYAIDLCLDEAIATGATRVTFSEPVPFYVENFLGFPVGTAVPAGSYDFEKSMWVPEDNGTVIRIDAITAGVATISPSLGLSTDELTQLATLYDVGDELWRVSIPHFSEWDLNWPIGFPDGADNPPFTDLGEDFEGDPCKENGSVIECETQVLGEQIPLVGTNSRLHYRSNRVPGRAAERTVRIPVTTDSPPAPLRRVDVTVEVAGQLHELSFPPTPGQSGVPFTWDGLDAYGRPVSGSAKATVQIGWVYDGVFQDPKAIGQSFSQPSDTQIVISPARLEAIAVREIETSLGPVDARGWGIGGWTLTPHHFYDPDARILYRGNGRRRDALGVNQVIGAFAGTGYASQSSANIPGPAADASFGLLRGIGAAPDGSLYLAAEDSNRVYKIDPSGQIEFVTGPNGATQGDGGLAVETFVRSPSDVEEGSDGSVYISQSAFTPPAIRRIGPDGIITTIAGGLPSSCSDASSGEGELATTVRLCSIGMEDIAVAPDGSVYFVHFQFSFKSRLRRVRPDGILESVAGGGASSGAGIPALQWRGSFNAFEVARDGRVYFADFERVYSIRPEDSVIEIVAGGGSPPDGIGDGLLATEAAFSNIQDIAVSPNGDIYVSEPSNNFNFGGRVRVFRPGGTIRRAAGTGEKGLGGNGGPAARATLPQDLRSIEVGADGTLYIAEFQNGAPFISDVRAVSPAFPPRSGTDLIIAADNGSELFDFDAQGRHLRTRHALTGADLRSFAYSAEGRLIEIREIAPSGDPLDDLVTAVERDAEGLPTAIVGPFGARSELTLDPNGFLDSVANPMSETYTLEYSMDGLLERFTPPAGGDFMFQYDALGRLELDTDPEGGSKALARTDDETGFEVSITTGLGRVKKKRIEPDPLGGQVRIRTDTAGLETVSEDAPGERVLTTSPSGMVSEQIFDPDPRFGLAAPIAGETRIQTPLGLELLLEHDRSVTTDPGSGALTGQVDTFTVNGRVATATYDAATRITTGISAEGRIFTAEVDAQGRLLETHVDGLEAVRLVYDTRGRLDNISQGTGLDERITLFTYDADGNLETVTDPASRVTSFDYDGANRVIQQTRPDTEFIDFGYDASGNLISLTPPGQPAHLFDYTLLDQTAEYDPPSVSAADPRTIFDYDLDRKLEQIDRPDGTSVTLGYDVFGRLETIQIPRGITTRSYDPVTGNVAGVVAPGSESLAFTYDGSLPLSITWAGTVAGSVSQTYDDDFLVLTQSVNGAFTATFGYDDDGLLIQAGTETLVPHAMHGLLSATTLGSITTTHGYNGFGELASDTAASGANELFANTYTRDKLGRIVQKEETIEGLTTVFDYEYDLAGRLETVSIDGPLARTYGYDANGNRVSLIEGAQSTVGVYDDQDRLVSYGDFTYVYNDAGDLISKTDTVASETTGTVYDALSNLTTVTLPDSRVIEYVIDASSRRVGKKIDGALVKGWLYHDGVNPVAELDGAGAVVSRFVYGSRSNVPDFMEKGGATYRIISDHLGSVRLVVDSTSGAVAQRLDYDEFGNVLLDTTPGFQPFGFAGGLYDPDTELLRFGVRDYDPVVGRWTTKDPIGFGGSGPNLYGYVLNDPVNLIDPAGLFDIFTGLFNRFTGGGDVDVPFSEIDPGIGPSDFPGFDDAVAAAEPLQTTPFSSETNVDLGAFGGLARTSFELSGTLVVDPCDNSVTFEGEITSPGDDFDFNTDDPGERDGGDTTFMPLERATRLINGIPGGRNFRVNITGGRRVSVRVPR